MSNENFEMEKQAEVMKENEVNENDNGIDVIDEIMMSSKKRKIITVISIVAACICFIGILVGASISQKKELAENDYLTISELYAKKDYDSALTKIEEVNEMYSENDKKITEKVNQLYIDIEEDLYKQAKNEMSEELCRTYLEYYKDGKYIEEINAVQEEIQLQKELKAKEEAEKRNSLLNLDDFINKHDMIVKEEGWDEGKCLSNNLDEVISKKDKTLPMSDYYPTVDKQYRYNVEMYNGVESTSIDVLTDSKDEILYLGYKIDAKTIGTNLMTVYQANCGTLFGAVTNQKWKEAYNLLGIAWNNASDGNTYNDILSCGNYEYFFSNSADGKYVIFVIRAKSDNK